MRNGQYYILTFNSTHDAIAAEKYLSDKIAVSLMPTLRAISASCGISLRVEEGDFCRAKGLLAENIQVKDSCTMYFVDSGTIEKIDI